MRYPSLCDVNTKLNDKKKDMAGLGAIRDKQEKRSGKCALWGGTAIEGAYSMAVASTVA